MSDADASVFTSQRDPLTNEIVAQPVARVYLSDGSTMRLYFGPKGVIAVVSERAVKSRALVLAPDATVPFGAISEEQS